MSVLNKYPKLLLFLVTVIVVYFLFSGLFYELLHNALIYLGYLGTFLAGLLYPYAFTSAAGTAMLIVLAKDQNLLFAGIVASVGALISDLVIFFFVRYSFAEEVQRLSTERFIQTLCKWIPYPLRRYLLVIFSSIMIASPLPTEIGVMLMYSVKSISAKRFAVIVYILHAIAIFIILLIGNRIWNVFTVFLEDHDCAQIPVERVLWFDFDLSLALGIWNVWEWRGQMSKIHNRTTSLAVTPEQN